MPILFGLLLKLYENCGDPHTCIYCDHSAFWGVAVFSDKRWRMSCVPIKIISVTIQESIDVQHNSMIKADQVQKYTVFSDLNRGINPIISY